MSLLKMCAAGTLATGLLMSGAATGAATAAAVPVSAHDWSHRHIVGYVVRPGDTATGLAVRFHAWTDELLAINHLARTSILSIGQHLKIPVVPPRLRPGHHRHRHHHRAHHHRAHHHAAHPHRHRHKSHHSHHGHSHHAGGGRHHHPLPDPSRATVREAIIRAAQRYHVSRSLALAVSWQEAGWQMDRVSPAGAIGAMQVLPSTGRWMSLYLGYRPDLRTLRGNVAAGVMLLRVLDLHTHSTRAQVGAYYQGLGAVQKHGLYRDTKRYVANVLAIQSRLRAGWRPA